MPDTSLPDTVIDYYTDILCVWAWIAQPRLEELKKQWGQKIEVNHRYVDVGYRILNTNIEELLKQPESEASWC